MGDLFGLLVTYCGAIFLVLQPFWCKWPRSKLPQKTLKLTPWCMQCVKPAPCCLHAIFDRY